MALRPRQHPLPHRQARQDVISETRRRRHHAHCVVLACAVTVGTAVLQTIKT
jgi:hypothetical protein